MLVVRSRCDMTGTPAPIESETVIVGASAAGLGVAACLARAGSPFVLLEQAPHVAAPWHDRYDRLHLHTSKGLSGLPYFGFPRGTPRYPSRDEVVAYLQAYAVHFALAPRFGQRVVSVRREGDRWTTRTGDASYRSARVVLATGHACEPRLPSWPGLERFGGPVIHSSAYRNGEAFRGQSVLVVGIGNSGAEIAIDLAEHGARPGIAVRGGINVVPRDFLGLPILAWGIALDLLPARVGDAIARVVSRLALGRWQDLGLAPLPYGPITQIRRHGRVPLLDVGTVSRIRRGEIAVHPGVESFAPGRVAFEDGAEHPFDAVVLATGYRPALGALLDPALTAAALDDEGAPARGSTEILSGLFCCGFHVSPTGMLREIAREARRIAGAITRGGP